MNRFMELTTGQMIDTLQVGQVAVANDSRKTYAIRNELGIFWTFVGDKKKAWRVLTADNVTLGLKWIIKEN